MFEYLICFIIVILLSIENRKKKKSIRLLTAIGIILIPSILAGLRDYSVGTDINIYILYYFNKALNSTSFVHFYDTYASGIETGYMVLVYLVSRFTSNTSWLLFFISLFIQTFVYLSLDNVRNENSLVIGEIIYLFLFYNETLNLMRQSMACALILYGFSFLLKENNYKKYFLIQIIAYFFHHSSILAIPLPILFYLFSDNRLKSKDVFIRPNPKLRIKFWIRLCLVAIIITLGIAFFGNLINILTSINLLNKHYQMYQLGTYTAIGNGSYFLLYSSMFIIPFLERNKKKHGYVYLSIFVCEICMFPLGFYLTFLSRLSKYYMYIRIFSSSNCNLYPLVKEGKTSKEKMLYIAGIAIAVFYWVWMIVINNNSETIPYLFK